MIQEIPAKEPNIGYVLFQAVEKKKKLLGKKLITRGTLRTPWKKILFWKKMKHFIKSVYGNMAILSHETEA